MSTANQADCSASGVDLLLGGLMLKRSEPMTPHHIGAIREKLDYMNDAEIDYMIRTGKKPNSPTDSKKETSKHSK